MPPFSLLFSGNIPLFSFITLIHPSILPSSHHPIIHLFTHRCSSVHPANFLSSSYSVHYIRPSSLILHSPVLLYVSHPSASPFTHPCTNLSSSNSLFPQPSALLLFTRRVFFAPFFSPFLHSSNFLVFFHHFGFSFILLLQIPSHNESAPLPQFLFNPTLYNLTSAPDLILFPTFPCLIAGWIFPSLPLSHIPLLDRVFSFSALFFILPLLLIILFLTSDFTLTFAHLCFPNIILIIWHHPLVAPLPYFCHATTRLLPLLYNGHALYFSLIPFLLPLPCCPFSSIRHAP